MAKVGVFLLSIMKMHERRDNMTYVNDVDYRHCPTPGHFDTCIILPQGPFMDIKEYPKLHRECLM